jgi:hypothetical protein
LRISLKDAAMTRRTARFRPDLRRAWLAVAVFLAVIAPCGPSARAATVPVDLELVLATDVSYSIDSEEARLQREGVANAFLSRDVVRAIRSGILGRIAVAYIDFASTAFNRVVIDWRIISDETSAAAFARDLMAAPTSSGRHTSISSALEMGARMIETNTFEGTRRTIDISGDGPNNFERRVDIVRDEVVARRITINGLPIINMADSAESNFFLPDLDRYYEGCVTGGPGSFVVPAKDFRDFARAMKKKLVLEIAGLKPDRPARLMRAQFAPRRHTYEKGCDIGERMRARRWGEYDLP